MSLSLSPVCTYTIKNRFVLPNKYTTIASPKELFEHAFWSNIWPALRWFLRSHYTLLTYTGGSPNGAAKKTSCSQHHHMIVFPKSQQTYHTKHVDPSKKILIIFRCTNDQTQTVNKANPMYNSSLPRQPSETWTWYSEVQRSVKVEHTLTLKLHNYYKQLRLDNHKKNGLCACSCCTAQELLPCQFQITKQSSTTQHLLLINTKPVQAHSHHPNAQYPNTTTPKP